MATTAARLLRAASGLLFLAALAYLLAIRAGRLPARPAVLAGLASALAILLLAVMALAARAALRERRLAPCCEAAGAAGVVVAIAAGLLNWTLGIQGAVLLMERSPVSLADRAELAGLETGPLADLRELEVTLGLVRLRLEGVGPEGFRAVSRLKVLDARGQERAVAIASNESAAVGPLVLHQGLFGFAPRVVVTKAGATLLDRHVPFRTVRQGAESIAFVEDFELGAEGLLFRGAVSLDDLNDEMKGHPRLELEVERQGARVGGGTLRPGEFVDLGGGVRVGFAGLQRWSEVVFSRRSYRIVVLIGALLAAAGSVSWGVAVWRGR